MKPLVTRALAVPLSLALFLAACGGETTMPCKKDPITGSEQCGLATSSGGEAAVAAGAAAASWAVVGCTVNGCLGAYTCNPKTKLCDPLDCDENKPCPAPYQCNLAIDRCE